MMPEPNEKLFQIHTQWVNSMGMTVQFSSDFMTLYDCLNVREEYPHAVITYMKKGKFRSVRVKA